MADAAHYFYATPHPPAALVDELVGEAFAPRCRISSRV
jgi:hypothetical protein